MGRFWPISQEREQRIQTQILELNILGTPRPGFTPMCVYGLTLYLVKRLLWQGIQKRSGDPNPQYFSKSITVQMGGVLPYKWEAYCSTNGRRIAGFPFLRSLEARKVRRYKWGAYCRTNWRCTAVLFRQAVGVGVSETLLRYLVDTHPPSSSSQGICRTAGADTSCI